MWLIALLTVMLVLSACAPAVEGEGSDSVIVSGIIRSVERVTYDDPWFAVKIYVLDVSPVTAEVSIETTYILVSRDPQVAALGKGDMVLFDCNPLTLYCQMYDGVVIESGQ